MLKREENLADKNMIYFKTKMSKCEQDTFNIKNFMTQNVIFWIPARLYINI